MRQRRFIRKNTSLLALYEYNYMLFRLLMPELPKENGWYVLEAKGFQSVYLHRLSIHPYTSEWLLAHCFLRNGQASLAPEHRIRLYHDARLVEARIDGTLPIREQYDVKRAHNRALAEWLDYCQRRGYRINRDAVVTDLPDIAVFA